ncbi:MAG: hypothetical protein M3H12_08920 [Chromatiales bacterium]|nr:hypothetical protein [Gammaproteobacteria bacterium]
MSQDYEDGKRDAQIESLTSQVKELWAESKVSRSWQNRAVGYIAVINVILVLLAQYLLKKFGV